MIKYIIEGFAKNKKWVNVFADHRVYKSKVNAKTSLRRIQSSFECELRISPIEIETKEEILVKKINNLIQEYDNESGPAYHLVDKLKEVINEHS